VLYLLEKCSAALIVLKISLEKFSEAFTERSLKMSGVLNSVFADVAKRTRDQLRVQWPKLLAHWNRRWWRG
jgi:hypothetical protein